MVAYIAQRSIGVFQPEADENKIHLDLITSVEEALVIADPLRTKKAVGNCSQMRCAMCWKAGMFRIEIFSRGEELAIINDNGPDTPKKSPIYLHTVLEGDRNPACVPRLEWD